MSVTKTKDFKADNLVYQKTDFLETNGNSYSKHIFKYKHSSGDGGSSQKNAKFKCDFPVTFPQGLYFDSGKKDEDEEEGGGKKFPKLVGKAILDFSDPKVMAFGDSPTRGAKTGWVNKKFIEATGEFNEFKVLKDAPYYEEANDSNESLGIIPKDTIFKSNEKEDDYYYTTFGGGGEGTLYQILKATSKLLWKKRKIAKINSKLKSEKEVEKALKFPIKFKEDDDGNVLDKADWYMKISYREKGKDKSGKKVDGFMAEFKVPGVGDMTLDEMLNNSITGKPCFTLVNVYEGSDKLSMQIYLSSCVVSDITSVEYVSAQQDDIDELAEDPEFVAKMKAKIGDRKNASSKAKGKPSDGKDKKDKKDKKNKKNKVSDDEESDDEDDKKESNIKSFLAPSMEKVDDESDDEESDDEVIKGVPTKKEEKKTKEKTPTPPSDDEEEEDEDEEEEEVKPPPKKEKAKKEKEKKKPPPPSDDEDEDEDEEEVKPPPKKEKKKKPPSDDEDDEDD